MQGPIFTAGKDTYTIYYTKGKIVGRDKNFETKVHGGGGGGATYRGTGGSAPISISSTTHIHDKIYLEHENGKQTAIELTNWDVACLEGHELIAFWLIKEGNERGPYVAIKNLTTDDVQVKEDVIKNAVYPLVVINGFMFFGVLGGLILAAIVLFTLFSPEIATFLGIAVLIGIIVKIVKRHNDGKQRALTTTIQVRQFVNSQE